MLLSLETVWLRFIGRLLNSDENRKHIRDCFKDKLPENNSYSQYWMVNSICEWEKKNNKLVISKKNLNDYF